MASSDEDLMRVTLFALMHDDFRWVWEKAVREAADGITASVAGARMAGATDGNVEVRWEDMSVPVPCSIGLERTQEAFKRAVMTEVRQRVEAMTSPGSFG